MKKFVAIAVGALGALAVCAAAMSLAEARGKISEVIENPVKMTSVMRQLSAEDQTQYLSDVNAAIGKMPGSVEMRTAAYLNVDRAAFKGSQKGNLATLVAEVFATVPIESLTVLNERFAAELFNRAADPAHVYPDDEYLPVASNLMVKVCARLEKVDDGAVRGAFAAMMMMRASNGTSEKLVDALVSALPEESREVAKNEWIANGLGITEYTKEAETTGQVAGQKGGEANTPEVKQDQKTDVAKADDQKTDDTKADVPKAGDQTAEVKPDAKKEGEGSYDSILAAGDGGEQPNADVVIHISGPQFIDSMLGDLSGSLTDPKKDDGKGTIVDAASATLNSGTPHLGDGEAGVIRGGGITVPAGVEDGKPVYVNPVNPSPIEPRPYQGQVF